MSHEIRTPLNSIMGMVSLLSDTSLTQEQREYCETMQRSAEGLLTVINDILDFSKIEAGKLTLELIPFNLLQTIEEVMDLLGPKAAEKNLEILLHYEVNPSVGFVSDPARIRQIFVNLLGNAIKFTESGHVIMDVMLNKVEEKNCIYVTVQDTGIGMKNETLKSLFTKFTQEDSSTTRRYGGTGLGLAICRDLLGLMGGQISVESQLGKGSIFKFNLPLTVSPPDPSILAILSAIKGMKILLVENNPIIAETTVLQLQHWEVTVEAALTVEAVLEHHGNGKPEFQAILVDSAFWGSVSELAKIYPMANIICLGNSPGERDNGNNGYYLSKPIRWSNLLKVFAEACHLNVEQTNTTPESAVKFDADVLLVEDNLVNQKVAGLVLKRLGCRVDVASNGLQAVTMHSHRKYDIILMDCQMPVMDGHTATKIIRSEDATIPIVAITANAIKGERERCLESGMNDYVSKPIQRSDLIRALTRWVGTNPPHINT